MTVGLPGAGIGGLFYILSALVMPLRELVRLARPRAARMTDARSPGELVAQRRLAWRQGKIAIGIGCALWATGEALGRALVSTSGEAPGGIASVSGFHRVLPASAFVFTFGSLALVLLAVEIARLVHVPRMTAPTPVPNVVAESASAGVPDPFGGPARLPSVATPFPIIRSAEGSRWR